jgi:hypothetical protein
LKVAMIQQYAWINSLVIVLHWIIMNVYILYTSLLCTLMF